ncbi:RNA polymerase sigma factor [Cupriavidus basilensis]|uniref:RNA polymerase sigma factor n=1 Tax=Cupriavidus basilensis TaxID=68895 RepID=UPI0007515F8B|nr:sigma-70 family RNA polymerase sigma factor [Cupriavidus basilensis]
MLRDPAHLTLFATLIRHYDDLVDHVRRRFGDRHFARDVVQDVCVQVLERPPAGIVARPLAFLRHVSTHRAIDRYRAEQARQQALDEWAAVTQAHGASAPDGAQALAFRQQVDRLAACIAALPPRCRDAFVLHRLHDLPQDEVAERLGISRGMVARHMARAMTLLAPALDELAASAQPPGSAS